MASILDNLKAGADFLQGLQITRAEDGTFDIQLSDTQVETMKRQLRSALLDKSGKPSRVRVSNMRRVILPVAAEISWPYILAMVGGGFLLGRFIR